MNATHEIGLHEHRQLNLFGWADDMLNMDRANYINQSEYGDGQLEGEFWIRSDRLATGSDGKTYLVLIGGSFGNYNSPGADHCTTAYLYDIADPDAVAAYHIDVARLSSYPEYEPTDDEPEGDETDTDSRNGGTEYADWVDQLADYTSPLYASLDDK
jgi:hypothetical protein